MQFVRRFINSKLKGDNGAADDKNSLADLHSAAKSGYRESVIKQLDNGVDVDSVDKSPLGVLQIKVKSAAKRCKVA